MKFYNRVQELSDLNTIYEISQKQGQLTVITGKRRMGKTMLALHFAEKSLNNRGFLYLFAAKKSEKLLCSEYIDLIKDKFEIPIIGEISSFDQVFSLLIEIAKKRHVTIIIDEFQEFFSINSSIYSDLQKLWDLNKAKIQMNLICIGSVCSLMQKIFTDSKEPLFGRADRIMQLKAFSVSDIEFILKDHKINKNMLFLYYLITGGVPKYLDILVNYKINSFDAMLDFILSKNSPFLNEGRFTLIEEFGKDYNIYFSILQLISSGKTSRSEIESVIGKDIGGYLGNLLSHYNIIERYKPIGSKPNTRLQKFYIKDNFLSFWFRFFYRNISAIENENFGFVKELIKRDFNTYSGKILEKLFKERLWSSCSYNQIGSYWEKANLNEIDIVAINDISKSILFADVKLKKDKLDLIKLKSKSEKLLAKYHKYSVEYQGFSLDDV